MSFSRGADLTQGAVSRSDNLVRPFAIRDRPLSGHDIAAKDFARDQTGGVILALVDPQTSTQASQSSLQSLLDRDKVF